MIITLNRKIIRPASKIVSPAGYVLVDDNFKLYEEKKVEIINPLDISSEDKELKKAFAAKLK